MSVNSTENPGIEHLLITCGDGLKGFPDAISATYPAARIKLCIAHLVCHSLKFMPKIYAMQDHKAVTRPLKLIYQSAIKDEARLELERFAKKWVNKYPQISTSWFSNWHNVITLFSYPSDIRKVMHTTNVIESLNSVIRKSVKTCKVLPSDDAALKVVYLAVESASKNGLCQLGTVSLRSIDL